MMPQMLSVIPTTHGARLPEKKKNKGMPLLTFSIRRRPTAAYPILLQSLRRRAKKATILRSKKS
jgi:hypothetical protein